jgi:hypothetical protein
VNACLDCEGHHVTRPASKERSAEANTQPHFGVTTDTVGDNGRPPLDGRNYPARAKDWTF